MAGGFGLAAWTLAGGIAPGAGYGSWRASVGAVLGADGFPMALAVYSGLLFALWLAFGRLAEGVSGIPAARLRAAVAPALWGASLPAFSPLLDAVCFWPTAAPLAALGIGLGLLAAGRNLARSGAFRTDDASDPVRALIAAAAVSVPALLLAAGWSPPSGDEPHYLIVAHSLAYDRDLDLADDYRDRVYAPFHPTALSPHYRPGLREGSRYSMHGIGLPVLLLPAYAVVRAWELADPVAPGAMVALPRLTLVLLYGVFAWMLYGFIEEIASAPTARWGTAATVLPAPLLFAPLAVFPEVPAMLLSLLAFRAVRRPAGGSMGHGLALAVLPFIGVKYIPLAIALFVVGAVTASAEQRVGRLVRLGVPLATGLGLHAAFTWRLYGSLSPLAIYIGAGERIGTPGLGGDWAAYLSAWPTALATLIGYFLDQKEGLLAYGPHFILAFAGLAALATRRRRTVLALAFVAAAYVGPYALSQQLGGQAPPVRPLMAVLWMLAPAVGVALTQPAPSAWVALRGGLLGLSAALTVAYASQPELLPHDYPVVASRLLQQYSPYGSAWWRLFPQWVNVDFPNAVVTGLWMIGVGALAVALWRQGARNSGAPAAAFTAVGAPDLPAQADPEIAADRASPGVAAAAADPASLGDAAAPVDPVTVTGRGTGAGAGIAGSSAGRRAAAAVFALACAFVVVHHAAIVRTDRHRRTEMGDGLVAWLPEQLPPVAFAERGGVWATPGRPVDFLLTAARPLGEVAVSLRVLVPAAVSAAVQGVRTSADAAPGAPHRARLRPARGVPDEGGYAYHVRLSADAGAAPADIEGGDDERFLGVLLQLTPVGR